MKKPFKIFGLGALTAVVLVVCMGQQIDIHNPTGQGLSRITAPYMSTLGQQVVTNSSPYQLASMIFGGTNLPGGLLTNGTSTAYLPGGQFGETNSPATFWGNTINTYADLGASGSGTVGSNGLPISISDGQNISAVNSIAGFGGIVNIGNGGNDEEWQGGDGGIINIGLRGIGFFQNGNWGTVNVGSLNVEGLTATVNNLTVNGTASGNFTGTFTGQVPGTVSNSAALANVAATNIFPGVSANNLNGAYYGMVPDGVMYNNISVTNIFLYSPNGNWTSGDIGKGIIINHGGINGRYFFTSISNVYSATQIGLSNSVVLGMTNLGYCTTYTHASAQSNYMDGQAMFNACSNGYGGNIFIPPPLWFSYFMGTTNVGSTYVIEGPFQNTNQNNAMWIVPPLGGANTPGSKAVVTLNGSDWGVWGTSFGAGNNGSFVSIPASSTVLQIAETGNHFAGTNGCGPSFIDGRAFGNPQGFSDNALFSSGNSIPENTCQLRVNHMGFLESWDSGICTLNFLGFTDGSGGSWVNVIGGAGSDNYYYQLGQYPSDTNGWAICGAGNNMGNELPMDNVVVSGQYVGFELGILSLDHATALYCSNALDASISPSVYDKIDVQLGGCFNGLNIQPCTDGLSGPALLHLVINDCGENTLPAGVRFHAINDQYWARTSNDGFFNSSGSIEVYTNFNNGSKPPPDFIWRYTSINPNMSEYLVWTIGANGQRNLVFGQQNLGYEVVTNFAIPASGTFVTKALGTFSGQGDAIRLNDPFFSDINMNIIGEQVGYGLNLEGTPATVLPFTVAGASYQWWNNVQGLSGPVFNTNGSAVFPTNVYCLNSLTVSNAGVNPITFTNGTIYPVLTQLQFPITNDPVFKPYAGSFSAQIDNSQGGASQAFIRLGLGGSYPSAFGIFNNITGDTGNDVALMNFIVDSSGATAELSFKTNAIATFFTNVVINGSALAIKSLSTTSSYADLTNGLPAGSDVFWHSNGVQGALYHITVNGTSTTVNKVP